MSLPPSRALQRIAFGHRLQQAARQHIPAQTRADIAEKQAAVRVLEQSIAKADPDRPESIKMLQRALAAAQHDLAELEGQR